MQLPELIKILQSEYPLYPNQEELSYSDEYAVLEAELQKLTSLYGEKPDFDLIIKNGLLLLQQGASHVFILTALSYALVQKHHWPGFLAGVTFIQTWLDRKWEGLYPSTERMKGRIQPFSWLVERWVQYLEAHPITGLGKDFLKQIHEALIQLDATCQQRFVDQVSLMSLIRPFEDQQKRVKLEEDARERQAKLDAEKKQQEAEAALQAPIEQEFAADVEMREDAYLDFIKQNPFEFSAYKYSRAEMWWRLPLTVQELLNVLDDHGLDWDAYSAALKLKAEQNYEEALIAFEALAHIHPYFLELQWHICDCLEALAADEPLLTMLKNECRELCTKYPELEGAKINNTYAVCSKQAKTYFGLFQVLDS